MENLSGLKIKVPLTSEIKSSNNKIFLLNQDNKFYIFDIDNGKKILDFETFPVILKKNNKQTLSIDFDNNIYFVTSAGQIFSLNFENYKINWLKNIKDESVDEFGLFFSSPIIVKEKRVFKFFSININTRCDFRENFIGYTYRYKNKTCNIK